MTDAMLPEGLTFITGVLDSLPHEIAVIDPQGVVIAVNDRWKSFARRSEEHTSELQSH